MGELSDALRAWIEKKMGQREADLDYLILGDAGTVFVAEKLLGNTIVQFLDMSECGLRAAGARALAKSLEGNDVDLEILCLNGNTVGDDGARAMAHVLMKNTKLERLELASCSVRVQGALALGEALKQNNTLEQLDIDLNDIGNDGAEALAEALRENDSLKGLTLDSCGFTDAGALSLLSALRESNSTLLELVLDGNELENYENIKSSIKVLLRENNAVRPASAERRARCLLFCCLKLAPSAHEHVVPSIGAVPVPVMQYAVEHAGKLHVAKRFEGGAVVGQSSARVRERDSNVQQSSTSRRR